MKKFLIPVVKLWIFSAFLTMTACENQSGSGQLSMEETDTATETETVSEPDSTEISETQEIIPVTIETQENQLTNLEKYSNILLDMADANSMNQVLEKTGSVTATYNYYDKDNEFTGSYSVTYTKNTDRTYCVVTENGYSEFYSGRYCYTQWDNGAVQVCCYLEDQAKSVMDSFLQLYYFYDSGEKLLDVTEYGTDLAVKTQKTDAEGNVQDFTYLVDTENNLIKSFVGYTNVEDEEYSYTCKIKIEEEPQPLPEFLVELDQDENRKQFTLVVDYGLENEVSESFNIPEKCYVTVALYDGYKVYKNEEATDPAVLPHFTRADFTFYMFQTASEDAEE